jgi:uncharacterized membrane-anchored protein
VKNVTWNTKFFLAVFLQLAILSALTLYHKSHTQGLNVFLRINQFDPATPLRGDYLSLDYPDISRIRVSEFDFVPAAGDIVYVPLGKKAHSKIWTVKAGEKASREKPSDGVFIRGVVKGGNDLIEITYGIESYFIPKRSGGNIRWSDNDYAEVSLDKNGNPFLLGIYLNGVPFPG